MCNSQTYIVMARIVMACAVMARRPMCKSRTALGRESVAEYMRQLGQPGVTFQGMVDQKTLAAAFAGTTCPILPFFFRPLLYFIAPFNSLLTSRPLNPF